MNKKILAVLLCMLMVAVVPVATGMQCGPETDDVSAGLFSRTVVRGFILGSRTEGMVTSFFALSVYYTTYSLFGEEESGVLVLQTVRFIGKFTGHMGRFYVSGTFHGTV